MIYNMKILTITAEYPPFFVGGITLHTYNLNISLADLGYEPWVITFHKDSKVKEYSHTIEKNVNIVRIPRPKTDIEYTYHEMFVAQNKCLKNGLIWMKNKFNNIFDLITVHGYFLGDAALYAKQEFESLLVYHVHTLFSETESMENKLIVESENNLCKQSNSIISVSEFLKKEIIKKFNISEDKIVVITKGIKLEEYDHIQNQKSKSNIILNFTGRLSPEKGFETLLEAMGILTVKYKKILLYAIGQASNTQYYDVIKNKINTLHLEKNIVFLGYKNNDEIIKEYKRSDISVVPSYAETFGKVAIESMAARVPVVVSNVGGLGPIVNDNVNGLLFNVGNSSELADKIEMLILNADLRNTLAENGYKEVKNNYQWHHILNQTVNEYSRIMEENL